MRIIFWLVLVCTIATTVGIVHAEAPRIVSTSPSIGAFDVSPKTENLVVVFDQPMQTHSWSWTGGGTTYPKIASQPSYIDERTAILPVYLEAQKTYIVGINSTSHTGFRSAAGEPAEPTIYYFTTTWNEGDLPVTHPDNMKAFVQLRRYWDDLYSYRERTGTDWNAVFDAGREWILNAPDVDEWALRASLLLMPADDPHLYLRGPDGSTYRTRRKYKQLNANYEAVSRYLENSTTPVDGVTSATIGQIGYLRIDHWSLGDAGVLAAQQALESLSESQALIVDVRSNGGGSELEARAIACYFIEEPAIYSKHRNRDPDAPGGWSPMRNRIVQPHADSSKMYRRPVFLLQGPICLSSNESFVLMMREAPRVTTIGGVTGGSSAHPRACDLPNGVIIILPRWMDYDPDENLVEGVGVSPDIPVEFIRGNSDPVFDKALEMARTAISQARN